jgi:hypothetical protein
MVNLMERRNMRKRISLNRKAGEMLVMLLALAPVAALGFVGNDVQAQSRSRVTPISKEQAKRRLERIINRGVRVLYPEFVPARFSLVSTRIVPDQECQSRDYELEFCDKNHLCFSIASLCAGLGDGLGDRKLIGKSKLLGSFTIDVLKPWAEGNGTKHVYYISEWLNENKWVINGQKATTSKSSTFHHFLGVGITDREAVAIVQSLRLLK